MKNPFKAAASTVADTWKSAGQLDFWSPGMARTMALPVIPVIAAVSFTAALFQKPDQK